MHLCTYFNTIRHPDITWAKIIFIILNWMQNCLSATDYSLNSTVTWYILKRGLLAQRHKHWNCYHNQNQIQCLSSTTSASKSPNTKSEYHLQQESITSASVTEKLLTTINMHQAHHLLLLWTAVSSSWCRYCFIPTHLVNLPPSFPPTHSKWH